MYHFAVVALLGLATVAVVDLLLEMVPGLGRLRTLTTFVLAVTAVVAVDYSLFDGFGIEVREAWIGTMVTGLVVGSLASAWRAVFGYLGVGDEREPGRRSTDRPRIAA